MPWLLIKNLCLVENVLEPTEEEQVETQPDKEESSVEAQESNPEEVTIDKGNFRNKGANSKGPFTLVTRDLVPWYRCWVYTLFTLYVTV